MSIARLPQKTLADYLAIAICPVLIMALVGSVIFFLLDVGYAGSHEGTLSWTFFWFVLAMVLVSRIAIERGSEHAGAYGFCLACATGFVLVRYVGFNFGMWVLLAFIWWATNKLTWDCTVIDEDEDASGEGLLQAAGIEHQPGRQDVPSMSAQSPPAKDRRGQAPAKVAWWERGLGKSAKRPHAPGMWVIYFSLAALPMFGLGEGLLARQAIARRQHAFFLLALYLVAALGLLLATSFLGLRRYLRQRYLQMPPAMAVTWLSTGTMIACAILGLCLLLPRPSAYWSFSDMLGRVSDRAPNQSREQTASRLLPAVSGTETNQADHSPRKGESSARPSESGDGKAQARQVAAKEKGAGETPRSAWSIGSNLLNWLRLAVYCVAAVGGIILCLKNRNKVLLFLTGFWRALLEFWRRLFAGNQEPSTPSGDQSGAGRSAAFIPLADPFASGEAGRMSAQELVVHTFRGLEAWGAEHGCSRPVDETPFEFADRLAAEVPDLAEEARQVARLYVQVAYASSANLPPCRTLLEILWSKMSRSRIGT